MSEKKVEVPAVRPAKPAQPREERPYSMRELDRPYLPLLGKDRTSHATVLKRRHGLQNDLLELKTAVRRLTEQQRRLQSVIQHEAQMTAGKITAMAASLDRLVAKTGAD